MRPRRTVGTTTLGLVVGAAMLLAVAAPSWATTINFPDFSSTAGLQLNGDAARSGSVLRLVPALDSQRGSAFPFVKTGQHEFHTHFSFRLHDSTLARADGFTFTVQNQGVNALGAAGGGLGYDGIAPSWAIEFDIFQNPENGDPDNNHVSLLIGGSAGSVFPQTAPFDLYGQVLYVWIDVVPSVAASSISIVRVFLNNADTKPSVPVETVSGGFQAFTGGDRAWTGFTAATGAANAVHDILSWTLADDGPRGSTTARGSLVGTGPLSFSSALDCNAASATRPFIAEWNPGTGTKRFTKTAVRTDSCENNPSGYASPAGFNEQRGSAVGTISGPGYQGPGSADFEYIDGGPGASAADRVRLVIRDDNGDVLYQSPLQQPGPYNGTPGGVWTLAP